MAACVAPVRRPPTRRVAAVLAAALAGLAGLAVTAGARAAEATPAPPPATVDVAERQAALTRASDATVGIEATAVDDAHSLSTLGKERQGSGVVIDANGLVLTIGYLILEADHVDIVLDGGRRVPARVAAYDIDSGFGLVQSLVPLAIPPAPLGRSAGVSRDEPLMFASGGDDGTLSLARMVSRRSFAGYWEYQIEGALFTVPARPDHSGAGLFNGRGELVGIGSLVVSDPTGEGSGGIRGNMFVPIDLLKPVLAELLAKGASSRSVRPWLGVNCVEFGGAVRIVRLQPESPAEAAGLRPGDVVEGVDGTPVSDLRSFYRALWREAPDRVVKLDVRRGPERLHLDVQAVDRMRTLRTPRGV